MQVLNIDEDRQHYTYQSIYTYIEKYNMSGCITSEGLPVQLKKQNNDFQDKDIKL